MPSFEKNETRVFIKRISPVWDYFFKKRFSGMERSTFNINSEVSSDKNNFMNMYSKSYSSRNFPDFRIRSANWEGIIEEREALLKEKIKEFGLDYKCLKLRHTDGEKIRFDAVTIGKNKKMTPYLAQDFNKSLINVREFKELNSDKNKRAVFINFLYFATQKLVNLYNSQRASEEHLKFSNFYIDSIYNRKLDICTFPLYNKGYVGIKDGKFLFGTERLGSGKLTIKDFELEWDKSLINSENIAYKPVLFTPEFFQNDSERFEKLTRDRINAVIINDRLITVKKGAVKMPSLGVVLSLPKVFEGEVVEKMKLSDAGNAYFKPEQDTEVRINLSQNEGYLWKYGGGTLIVRDGENLVHDEKTARAAFYNEGWYNPLSMETQETQVQDWVRGPRSVIGEDFDGNLFMAVFSGRTKESVGARFDEMVNIIQTELCDVKNLINLDGGASACLGLIYRNEFFELSLPCATNFTCTGMVRPVNSFLITHI
jgi:hypothetical protein